MARVEKPKGEMSRLMGSSFITDRSTRPVAATSPGPMIGRSTVANRRAGPAFRVRAASCSQAGTDCTATTVMPMARDPKRTT